MDNLLLYILKVSAGTTLLYLCYLLLFRKDTFYRRNRIFLILILLLPPVFPALKIPVLSNAVTHSAHSISMDNMIFPDSTYESAISGNINSFDYNSLFISIYFIIAGLLMVRIVVSLISTYRIIRNGTVKNRQLPIVVISDNQFPPFSFFPYAVIPEEEYLSGNYTDILDHEAAHIRQGHTFDLLLGEIFIAFQWFNPFVWLIKRSIIMNHEYLADNVSLQNKSVKEYQYMLLKLQTRLRNISLVHSFNSLIKNRIIMINKKPTRKYATLKNVLILPVAAFVVYAFATPEYRYSAAPSNDNAMTIYQTPAILQKVIKGIVLNEDGKPLEEVNVTSTGTAGNAYMATTGTDGRFSIINVQADASLIFSCRGYKGLVLKPDFTKEMSVKMGKDPEYKTPAGTNTPAPSAQRPTQIVVIDGVISNKNFSEARKELAYDMGIVKMLIGKEATDKYGEKGANGVYEITTRKKALEMGLKPPFPRLAPEDYPTFQNQRFDSFSEWVSTHAEYPAEAKEKKLEGWVTVNFRVELDGAVSNVVSASGIVDPILVNEIIRTVQSSPKWESSKNKAVDEALTSSITVKFKLPDQILNEAPFVVVEQMPSYPGGDVKLLDFIKNNTKYPEAAKTEKIEGRVIIRFIVNTEGNVEGISILKGVHPLLDAEAVRVVSGLTGFNPGMQGGKPVNVWYMVPVNFSLTASEPLFSNTSEIAILKFLGMNTGYPQEAKASSDTGKIFVVVKWEKGGIIKDCKAFTEKTGIKVLFLPEVVIVGNKPSAVPGDLRSGKETGNTNAKGSDHIALQTESVRIANKLAEVDIPEWKEKNMEFALVFHFVLK